MKLKILVALLVCLSANLAQAQNVPFIGQGSWQACGTATGVTTDVEIKAAITGKYIYVTTITCKNTAAATATSLDFKSATTVIGVGGIGQMAAAAPGSFTANFDRVPLKTAVSAAFNFATNVATTSVVCCAAGYIDYN